VSSFRFLTLPSLSRSAVTCPGAGRADAAPATGQLRDGRPVREGGKHLYRHRVRRAQPRRPPSRRQGVAVLDGTHVDPRKGERLLSEVAAEWRETWTDLEPKTRIGYDSILNVHIVGTPAAPARFHRAKVGGVSPEVYQRWINDLAAELAPNTVHRINTVLSAVLRLAVQRRYIAVHPGDAVKLPKKRRSKRKMLFLTPGEVRALAEAIDPHYRVAVYVAAWCGFRAGEQWALKREDVDLQAGTIRVDEALKEVTAGSKDDDLDDVVRLSPSLIIGSPKSEASHRTIKVPAPRTHRERLPGDPRPSPRSRPLRRAFAGTTSAKRRRRSRSRSRRTSTSSRSAWGTRTSGRRSIPTGTCCRRSTPRSRTGSVRCSRRTTSSSSTVR
jgi:integrase